MDISVRPKNGQEIKVAWPTGGDGELSSNVVAQRAVELFDRHGDGKVTAGGWTYKYIAGKIQPVRHC